MAQGTTRGVPIDIDPLLAADSDLLVPSQKAVKSYAQPQLNGTGFVKASGTTISYDNSTYLTGTGASGQVAFWNGTTTQTGSNNLFWDNVNSRLGIGTTTPTTKLDVLGGFKLYTGGAAPNNYYLEAISTSSSNAYVNLVRNASAAGTYAYYLNNGVASLSVDNGSGETKLYAGNGGYYLTFYSNNIEAMRIPSATRNVLIGTTTDAGYKLDVNGTARVGSASVVANLRVSSSGRSDFYMLSGGSTTDNFSIYLNGGAYGSSYVQMGLNDGVSSGNQGGAVYFDSRTGTAPPIRFQVKGTGTTAMTTAGSIYPTANWGIGTSSDAGYKLDVNGTGRFQTSITMGGAADATLFFPNTTSGHQMRIYTQYASNAMVIFANGYNLNLNGAGGMTSNFCTTITGSNGSPALTVQQGNVAWTPVLKVNAIGSTGTQFNTNGNVLIGTTTDAGYKLDIFGTTRIYGASTSSLMIDTVGTVDMASSITFRQNSPNWSSSIGTHTSGGGLHYGLQFKSQPSTVNFVINRDGSTYFGGFGLANSSSLVELSSTTKGFLPPRMTNAQRTAIATPAVGLIVYCTDATEGLYIYKSTGWTFII
jgi:hypothetical protein